MLVNETERIQDCIDCAVERFGHTPEALLPILHAVQQEHRHISSVAMQEIADRLGLHPVEVDSVVSFYHFFESRPLGRYVIRLCNSASCELQGKALIRRMLVNELGVEVGETTPDGRFTLQEVGCIGMCDQGPALMINDRVFTRVSPDTVSQIIRACRRKLPLADLADQVSANPEAGHRGTLTFNDYPLGAGLAAAVKMGRAEIVDRIGAAGLMGRGGAGFPTSVKWNLVAAARDETKYVVCNADEGEPGTFKDRWILSQHPHLLLEGMTIAARAVGAKHGILYLREEYSFLLEGLERAIQARRSEQFLGDDILGEPGFRFDVRVHLGAGAYVCGEETALIESLEGHRGEPRNRPPFPVDTGYAGHPTTVNNVETLAWVPCILAQGVEWFAGQGTPTSKGLKLLSVSGDCAAPGVYEVPYGIPLTELLALVGATDAKAVQVGGASGVCVPAAEFHRTIAPEDLATGGAVLVLGPHRELSRVALGFLEFFAEESCGQCTPCREGIPQLVAGLTSLREGRCSGTRLRELRGLAETLKVASKCGLGQSSPNALLSMIEHFPTEMLQGSPSPLEGR